jgi:GTP-binding protein
MDPVFQAIVDHVPAPNVDREGAFQMQISQLDYNSFLVVIVIGRIDRGKSAPGSATGSLSHGLSRQHKPADRLVLRAQIQTAR